MFLSKLEKELAGEQEFQGRDLYLEIMLIRS